VRWDRESKMRRNKDKEKIRQEETKKRRKHDMKKPRQEESKIRRKQDKHYAFLHPTEPLRGLI
jgi:hypothetical protein